MFSLAKIEIAQFLKPYVKDAIEFPDIETLSALLEIKRTDAEKIVVKNKEELAGYKVRDVICTKEARELKREILKILASYTMTKNGKEFALTLTPILEIEELQKRFEDVRETGRLIAILGNEKIDRVRKIISEAAIEEKTRSYSYRRSPPPIIATRQTGLELEAEINEQYGDFVHVAIVETAGKAEELSQKGTIILLLSGEGEGEDAAVGGVFDEPGIITITRDDLSDVCVVYPEFVVNSFAVKKKAILAVIRLLTEFKELKDSFLFFSIVLPPR
ncbi:MAG: hypothetical protein H0M93_04350 [Methanophagales archaeon]|nr:hypothetical protein [Methanophagales archaeon]